MKAGTTTFDCNKCGACCILPGKLGLMPQRKDGACYFLDTDMSCKIYENRPDVCRVKLGKDGTYNETKRACNSFQEHYEMDEKFRYKDV